MRLFTITAIFLFLTTLNGCAVNDPERNPFPVTKIIIVDDIKSLSDLERKTIDAVDRDDNVERYEGILLADLLKKEGVISGSKLSGDAMTDIIIVEAIDGYKVSFTLAEIDDQFNGKNVILADTRDGEPLGDASGKPRLVVPDETKRQARWVKDVAKIKIIHVE